MMRAKMRVTSVTNGETSESVSFAAVGKSIGYPSDGSDDLTMSIANPALIGKFAVGDQFYVDFTPAAQPAQVQPEG